MRATLARLELDHGPGFGDHGSRVAALAIGIGRQLGLKEHEARRLHFAAFVHDVGKTHIDPSILDKESPLGTEELAEVRRHPQIGYSHLEDLVHPAIGEAILCHHERWDGAGYPSGLRGKGIPLFSRIIFVADAFDVMTSHRAYRSQMTISEAGDELSRSSGRQFDPKVLDAFASLDYRLLEVPAHPLTPEPRLYG